MNEAQLPKQRILLSSVINAAKTRPPKEDRFGGGIDELWFCCLWTGVILCIIVTIGDEAFKLVCRKNWGANQITKFMTVISAITIIVYGCCIYHYSAKIKSTEQFNDFEPYLIGFYIAFTATFYIAIGISIFTNGIIHLKKAKKPSVNINPDFPGTSAIFPSYENDKTQNLIRYLFEPLFFLIIGLATTLFFPFFGLPLIVFSISF